MNHFWHQVILGNTVKDWAIPFSIILLSGFILRLFQAIVLKRIKSLAASTSTTIDDFIVFLSPDYNTYMDIHQSINPAIFELFEKEKIGFTFPMQTIFLSRQGTEQVTHDQIAISV